MSEFNGDLWSMNKAIYYLKQLLNSFILAGIIILFIGLYYMVVRAGMPYQDPPLELQAKYAVSMGIGEELIKDGVWIVLLNVVMRVIAGVIWKRK